MWMILVDYLQPIVYNIRMIENKELSFKKSPTISPISSKKTESIVYPPLNLNLFSKKIALTELEIRRRQLARFSAVDNVVLFVNPDMQNPFQLEEGQPSPLGVFASPRGNRRFEYWPNHERTILVGHIPTFDNKGRIYWDVDLKGIGVADPIATGFRLGQQYLDGGRHGLLERDIAFPDYEMAEQFLSAGIRTYRVLAIIELRQLIMDGETISLDEAIKRGMIDDEFNPVVSVKAFTTKARVQDLKNSPDELKKVKKLVAKELGKDNLSNDEYLTWFAENLGRNLGLMHRNGWVHKYLSMHNITLDCSIVDLDSVAPIIEAESVAKDFLTAGTTLGNLLWLVLPTLPFNYHDIFIKSYDKTFAGRLTKKIFT